MQAPHSILETRASSLRRMRGANRRGNLALNLPIAWRLTLGFLVAGLIAAAAAGVVGAQRAQALGEQSGFYQSLLQNSTNLATGDSFLQLMNTKAHEILDVASSPDPSTETLTNDEQDVPRLAQYYDAVITGYATNELLSRHADQLAILQLAGDMTSATRQAALISSALRTWRAYSDAQTQVLARVTAGDIAGAELSERLAAEPTNADAQSALRALIQFNDSLSRTVRESANAQERNLTITSLVAALLAFVAVALVGWFISETIVRRLRSLRLVTKAVENGHLDSRVLVIGSDEIGDVSASVNDMLDTIVGLLEETRRQHNALSNAAERLFSDMRVASGGDLRVSASVSSDPIGLLGNAFNLTIGRFKRFISRSRLATEQLEGVARQQVARSDAFIFAVSRSMSGMNERSSGASAVSQPGSMSSWPLGAWSEAIASETAGYRTNSASTALVGSIEQALNLTERLAGDDFLGRARRSLELAEQAYLALVRLMQLLERLPRAQVEMAGVAPELTLEVRALDAILQGIGQETYTLNQSAPSALSALREALSAVESTLASGAFTSSAQPNAEQGAPAQDTQVFEFVQLASGFAQEMSAFARQLVMVAQEMRVNVAPFQLESSSERANDWSRGDGYQRYVPPQGYQSNGVGRGQALW